MNMIIFGFFFKNSSCNKNPHKCLCLCMSECMVCFPSFWGVGVNWLIETNVCDVYLPFSQTNLNYTSNQFGLQL